MSRLFYRAGCTTGHMKIWFKERTFLLRLLFTVLLAGCIPLIAISCMFIQSKQDDLDNAARLQLASVAKSVAFQLDDYQNLVLAVNTKIQMNGALFGNNLPGTVSDEIEALEIMKYMKVSMPFVKEYGFYVAGSSDAVFSTTGKYEPGIYASYVLGIDRQIFMNMLTSPSRAHFTEWGALNGLMMYIVPIRIGSSDTVSRICFYMMSPSTLTSALSSLLTDWYHLAAIYDPEGLLIYSEEGCPVEYAKTNRLDSAQEGANGTAYVVQTVTSARGFHIVVYASKTAFLQNVDDLASYIKALVMLNIFICIALIAAGVMLNYKSINRVFLKIRSYGSARRGGENELQYIMNAFSDQADESEKLQLQLREQRVMIIDQVLESLLSGKPVPENDLKYLKFDSPFYFVAIINIDDGGGNIGTLVARNGLGGSFYVIEMYADGYLTFVCRCGEPSRVARGGAVWEIQKTLGGSTVRMGVSTACDSLQKVFFAYREATRAFSSHSDEPVLYADDLTDPEGFSDKYPVSTAHLSYAIKIGDRYAVGYANEAFDRIESGKISPHIQQYSCFQLLELYRKAGENADVDMDMQRLSDILGRGNVTAIRGEFISLLHELLERQKELNSKTLAVKYSRVIEFINDNFTDPMFGVNTVAAHLGVTVYAAGRILKNLSGINFRKYLNDKRIDYAKDLLLTTGLSVAEISEKVGFLSSSYFIKIFRSSEDITPMNYRLQSINRDFPGNEKENKLII